MINHCDLCDDPEVRRKIIYGSIKAGKIRFGGNKKLAIYGRLSCSSGKRVKIENRVFFKTEKEALEAGFRPCAHCMLQEYIQWRSSKKNQ